MKIADIDYYATCGKSWLNKTQAKYKLLAALFVILAVILVSNYVIMGAVYMFLLSIILFSRIPKFKVMLLSLYPLIFIAFYFISFKNLSYSYTLLILFKALSASTCLVLLIFTTTYVEIFTILGKFMPLVLVNILFLTYRSIFILWEILENLQLAMYIRGTPKFGRPIYSIKLLGNSLGYLIIRAIESSQCMYEALILRGYSDKIRYIRK